MMNNKIIDFLKTNGPSLPVEIGKAIGYDSMLTKAVLGELISKGLIKKSHRSIGNSLIYYLPEQVNMMRKRLINDLNIPERRVLNTLKEKGKVLASKLSPHERAFLKRLIDFIHIKQQDNDYLITHYTYSNTSSNTNQKPLFQQKPQQIKNDIKIGFESKVKEYLNIIGKIISAKKIKNNEYDYEVNIRHPFPQELYVKAKNKKTINENDLSMLYAEVLRHKKPALLITTGKLSKKAEKWKKENIGSLVKVISLKNY